MSDDEKKRVMAVTVPPPRPPEAVLSEGEYQLLDSIRQRMDTLQDVQKSQGERIEALEDSEAKRDQTLERIETKLDGLHDKDQEHDERLNKLHTDVKEVVSDGVGNAQQSLSKAKWGAVLVLLLTTAPTWLPEIVKLVEVLAK